MLLRISRNYSTSLCRPRFSAAKRGIPLCSFDLHRQCHLVHCNQYRNIYTAILTGIFHTIMMTMTMNKHRRPNIVVVTKDSKTAYEFMSSYEPHIVTMSLSCTISETQRDIGRKLPTVTHHTYILCPHWAWSHLNFIKLFGIRKLDSWAIVGHCLHDPT